MPISIHAPRAGRDFGRKYVTEADLEFQSTRPVRGATLFASLSPADQAISIHAPRAGRDSYENANSKNIIQKFQSTRPVRGATTMCLFRPRLHTFQSTRPVRGATLQPGQRREAAPISIHAPRAGRDHQIRHGYATALLFQSTRPVRGATVVVKIDEHRRHISIHAPRAGRDPLRRERRRVRRDFNPRAPCGARHPLFR